MDIASKTRDSLLWDCLFFYRYKQGEGKMILIKFLESVDKTNKTMYHTSYKI
jgi:hypothetical protein